MSDDEGRIAAYEKFESWGVPATRRLHDEGRLPSAVAPFGQSWLDEQGQTLPVESAVEGETPRAEQDAKSAKSFWGTTASIYAGLSIALVLGIIALRLIWHALVAKVLN